MSIKKLQSFSPRAVVVAGNLWTGICRPGWDATKSARIISAHHLGSFRCDHRCLTRHVSLRSDPNLYTLHGGICRTERGRIRARVYAHPPKRPFNVSSSRWRKSRRRSRPAGLVVATSRGRFTGRPSKWLQKIAHSGAMQEGVQKARAKVHPRAGGCPTSVRCRAVLNRGRGFSPGCRHAHISLSIFKTGHHTRSFVPTTTCATPLGRSGRQDGDI